MKRLVSLVAVGCVLALASPAGATLHLTNHQRSQLRTWYAKIHHQFSVLTADVSNLTGQPLSNSISLCENLTQSAQGTSTGARLPVPSVAILWRSTFATLSRGANDCVAGNIAKATNELKQGTKGLTQVVTDLQKAGVTVTVPGPPLSDLSITSCSVDPNDSTTADIGGTIINHTGVTNDYDISMNLLQGSVRIGSASDIESNIAGGQTSTWSTFGNLTGGNGGAITCQLVGVQRTPSS